jgi:hypothetical protein
MLTPFIWKMKDEQIRPGRTLLVLRSLASLWGHGVVQLWLRALICDPDPLASVRAVILAHLLGIKGILIVNICHCLLHRCRSHEGSRSCHVRQKHLLLVLLGIYYYYRRIFRRALPTRAVLLLVIKEWLAISRVGVFPDKFLPGFY